MRQNVTEKYSIKSEEELVAAFLKESVGLYVKGKSNEHTGELSNKELRVDVKEDIGNLLDGLGHYAPDLDRQRVNTLISTLRDNLDGYISEMDKELTKARDNYLLENNNLNPNALHLDQAMKEAVKESNFVKMAQQLKDKNAKLDDVIGEVKDSSLDKIDEIFPKLDLKDTGWKPLAEFFKKLGITGLASFFENKNEEGKLMFIAKSAMKGSEGLIVKTAPKASTIGGLPLKGDSKQR
jgi:acetone carboxylase gamma subunit